MVAAETKRGNSLPVWFLVLVGSTACLLVVVLLSGILKWILLALLVIAWAGVSVKEGIKGFLGLAIICCVAFIALWLLESPEFHAGVAAYKEGDYALAIEKMNQELTNNPKHTEALLYRCQAKRKSGSAKQALPDCNQVINIGCNQMADAYSARARVHQDMGLLDEAAVDFNFALIHTTWDSTSSKWYLLYERGIVHNLRNQPDAAISDLCEVLALKSDWYHAWWPLGNAYYKKQEFNKALEAYERYLGSYKPSEDSLPEALKIRINQLRQSINPGQ